MFNRQRVAATLCTQKLLLQEKEKEEERGLFDDLLAGVQQGDREEERPSSSGYQSIQQYEDLGKQPSPDIR